MRGKAIALSLSRRLVGDYVRAARSVPSIPVRRRMNLAEVVAARAAHPLRPSWQAIFIKAYAQIAERVPELRRSYVKFPWPHLYELPHSVASVVVERDFQGEKALFTARLSNPAALSLDKIHHSIREFQEQPIEERAEFRRALRITRMPWPLRPALWWLGLNVGRMRSRFFGTFAISTYSALGAESLHPITPLTTTLNYGVIAPDGSVDACLVYDHRVLDGATVARALASLEAELVGPIVEELRAAEPLESAAA